MSETSSELLVLGLGNLLLGDDGAGPAVIAALHDRLVAPPGMRIMTTQSRSRGTLTAATRIPLWVTVSTPMPSCGNAARTAP